MTAGNKNTNRLYHQLESGIVIPSGYVSNHNRSYSETYLQIKEKAIELEAFYHEFNVIIPDGCGLSNLLKSAKTLSDSWLKNDVNALSNIILWDSAHLIRVSESIFTLRGEKDIKFYLKKLTKGSLNLLQRDRSEAKDFLWELELLHKLRSHGVEAVLKDPPDIVAAFEDSKIGIACKKIYSENNVEKVLSNGVSQIEREYEFGIVAINIDDLTPSDSLLVANSKEAMADKINKLNDVFLKKHERHFRKYLSTGRILSALVSTTVLADLEKERVRLNNASQSTVWMIPGLTNEKTKVFKNFYNQIMA